jgi:hypothetical protein
MELKQRSLYDLVHKLRKRNETDSQIIEEIFNRFMNYENTISELNKDVNDLCNQIAELNAQLMVKDLFKKGEEVSKNES